MIPKQELELYLFDEFRRLSADLPLTHIEQAEPPAPDILADFQGSRIGIEITRYLREPDKQRESEEERIVEMACRQYQATGKPSVGVSVHWIIHKQRPRSTRKSLSQALASVVAQNVPQLGTFCDLDWSLLPEPLASTVHYVRIDRLVDYTESDWRPPRAGWFPTVQPDHIRGAIAKKSLALMATDNIAKRYGYLSRQRGSARPRGVNFPRRPVVSPIRPVSAASSSSPRILSTL